MATKTRQLAAVMFSDIEGYTALMHENEQLAQVWRSLHRRVFQETHQKYDGRIIQYFGDGSLSVFESALNAIKCAVDIQQLLRSGDSKVPLRIGLHLGEIVWDGDDIFGDGVNIASRVESFSVPGAVLISDRLYEQVRNHNIPCQSMGYFQLKNVSRQVELFAVEGNDLVIPDKLLLAGKGASIKKTTFNNLPKQTNSFIGREQEHKKLTQLVQYNRLVTITGPGGTGKTRMSITLSEALLSEFEDGVCWLPLAPINDANQVAFFIAQVLSIVQDTTQSIEDLLFNFMEHKHMLLVLDNFEHVMNAADLVERFLHKCPNLYILVTSRNPLKIYGEQEFPLSPLELPNDKLTVSSLEKNAAVSLFCQRARAIHPGFNLNEENALSIANICTRLDGLPLAIELAAARVKLFSPQALLSRLNDNFELLKGGWIGQDARHFTLHETIDWSYRLLDPDEKQLFELMSVFVGGATLEAIESIGSVVSLKNWDVLELVVALVDKSLLQKGNLDLDGRFFMLETIRYYAQQNMMRSAKFRTINQAHALYYLNLAEKAQTELTGKDQLYWLSLLEKDLGNLRSAIAWFIETESYAEAYRLGIALWRFWITKSLLIEGVTYINTLLSLPYNEGEPRLKLLFALGTLYLSTTEYPKARPIFVDILTIRRQQNNLRELASVLNSVGFLHIQNHLFDEGFAFSQEALELYQHLEDREGMATSFQNIGWAYAVCGQPHNGLHHLEMCLQIRREFKDNRRIGYALVNLAFAEGKLGKLSEALALLQEAEQLLVPVGDTTILTWAYIVKSLICLDLDDLTGLENLVNIIETHSEKNPGIKYVLGWNFLFKSMLLMADNQHAKATTYIEQGMQKFNELGMLVDMHEHHWQLANFKHQQFEIAYELAQKQISKNFQKKRTYDLLHNLEVIAMILAIRKKFEKATTLLAKATALRQEEHVQIIPWLKSEFDHKLALLRKELTDQHFDELWGQGLALPLEDAVELALEE